MTGSEDRNNRDRRVDRTGTTGTTWEGSEGDIRGSEVGERRSFRRTLGPMTLSTDTLAVSIPHEGREVVDVGRTRTSSRLCVLYTLRTGNSLTPVPLLSHPPWCRNTTLVLV